MIGDMKGSSTQKLTHVQFAKVHRWCSDNGKMLREQEYAKVAQTATSVFGFHVSASSIGTMARDLGINKKPANGHADGGGKGAFLPNNVRAQAIYQAIEELYEQLEIKSARRDKLRSIFGVAPRQ